MEFLENISFTTLQNVCTNLCLSPDGTKRQLILRLKCVPKEELEEKIQKEEQRTVNLEFMQQQLFDENVQPSSSAAILKTTETTNNDDTNKNIETNTNIEIAEELPKQNEIMTDISRQTNGAQNLQPTPQIRETNVEQNNKENEKRYSDGGRTDDVLTASLRDRELDLLKRENALLKREQEMLRRENEMFRTVDRVTEQPAATGVSLQLVSNFVANYDGKTDGKFWVVQLREIQKTYKLSDNMLRALFATKLTGRAQSWLHSWRNSADEGVDELLQQFCLTFGTKKTKLEIRREFELRKWNFEEQFADYFNDKLMLASNLPMEEDELVEYVVDGIPNINIRTQVSMQQHTTTDELFKALASVKLTKPSTNQQNKGSAEKKQTAATTTKIGVRCYNCNSVGHYAADCGKPRRLPGTCYACGSADHTVVDCWQNKKKPLVADENNYVNVTWGLPYFACDFYIAMDVICSTSSIFNLVAISVDRYIAVTQPIKYAKHRNSRRVCLTIVMVWAISAAIGSPIVLGLNNTPDRDPSLCMFYNTDFIVYSSLSSFYIPCIIMVFLYWNIFSALRKRARKQRAARKPHISELTGGSVIENIAQTRRLAETALDSSRQTVRIMPDEPATNTGSGSNEEEDDNAISPDIDDCHVIVNDKSTEFMLATVVEETGKCSVVAQITTQPQLMVSDSNGNHDSGYAPSNVDDVLTGIVEDSSPPDSPVASGTLQRSSVSSRRNTGEVSPKREQQSLSAAMKPLPFIRYGVQEAMTLARNDSTLSATSKSSSRKDKKNIQASRFTIYKVHKASKKKREKTSAKKERKATKTLAIVLGVFLFCWLPFFSCNIMDAMCSKFDKDCSPGVTAFIFTTWLGYINSFVNPVIYTIFNPEFRKAFKKIMHIG